MANEMYKTRAGINPSDNALPFSVTTREVEDYLQKRVDAMVKASNGKVEKVDIKIYSTESGKKFIPFVVVLPLTVLKRRPTEDNDVEYIFNQKNDDRNVEIKDEYYQFFRTYVYNADDEKSFFSDNWRHLTQVSRDTSPTLKNLRTPKVMTYSGTKVVLFMVDPLRVFYDMVTREDDKRQFSIDIKNFKKIETGNFRYDFNRVINNSKNKKGYNATLINELNSRMRGRR